MRFQQLAVPTAWRLYLSAVSLLVVAAGMPKAAAGAETAESKKIFNQRCTACHTFGHGVKVGPDLKGVTARRQRPWLLKFIRSSQTVIGNGDPVATTLFEQFKRQRMPDWTDLSEKQVNEILDWFSADGPDQKEPDERAATTATKVDVARGRALFAGATNLAHGGVSCISCHAVKTDPEVNGGTLGPDLTVTFSRYQDRALTVFLKRPCFKRVPEANSAAYLTPEESFAIKAYLHWASTVAAKTTTAELAVPPRALAERRSGRGQRRNAAKVVVR